MKVYSHYEIINGIEYRWRTLLQLGDSWDVCGTVVMKNPGSSNILIKENGKSIPIMDEKLLEHLKVFDHAKSYIGYSWYLFSVDNTMACVGHIFEDYLRVHKKPIEGIIQIFNLFNIKDPNLGQALQKNKIGQGFNLFMTTDEDVKDLVPPIYLGWGNLKQHIFFKENAHKLFEETKKLTSYLNPDYDNNPFYHPQYLSVYGKNNPRCIQILSCFLNDKYELGMGNENSRIFQLKSLINNNGSIQKIWEDRILYHEYFTNVKGGKYVSSPDRIVIDLTPEEDNNQYVVLVFTRQNDEANTKKLIKGIWPGEEFNPWSYFKARHIHKVISFNESNEHIAEIMKQVLNEVKAYRDKTFPI